MPPPLPLTLKKKGRPFLILNHILKESTIKSRSNGFQGTRKFHLLQAIGYSIMSNIGKRRKQVEWTIYKYLLYAEFYLKQGPKSVAQLHHVAVPLPVVHW